jgi:hypothetical protein
VASASGAGAGAGADTAISAALERLAQCENRAPKKPALGPDGKVDLDELDGLFCPHELAWEALLDQLDEQDDLSRKNHTRLASTCGGYFGHASVWVRRAAYRCVAKHPDGVAETRAQLEGMLAKLANEKDADVQRAMWNAVGALDPTKHGLAARAVELARAQAGDEQLLEAALEALLPSSPYQPTSGEALGFAVELAKSGRGGGEVVKLITASAMTPTEACELHAATLESKGKAWASGLDGMAATEGRCKAFIQRAVDAIVARTEQAQSSPEAWQKEASLALRDELDALALEAAQKTKLRAALTKLSKEQREAYGMDVITPVIESLR